MNALFVQLVVEEKDLEVVVAALTVVLEDHRVIAGAMDGMLAASCPTLLDPVVFTRH